MEARRDTSGPSRERSKTPPCAPAERFRGRAVTVMGLGLFGGGAGAARYLARAGARVTVTDLKDAGRLAASIEALKGLPITYHLGGHAAEDFTRADAVVVNPAVDKPESGFVRLARQAGAEITAEMNLFIEACPAPVLGVTGSSGKSTTTALAGDMLRLFRPSRVGGNIGISLLDELGDIRPDEWIVLELSSFQLEDLAALRWSPRLAVTTCISPNHLDRHKSMPAYIDAKKNIVRFQRPGDTAVLNADDPELAGWQAEVRAAGSRAVLYSIERPLTADRLRGGSGDPPRGGSPEPPRQDRVFFDGSVLVLRMDGREERV
ncbi:MAG: hypothetical protein FJ288_19475, partial [Planctomycetes bacterium]|nr:hypothetical protein [Planctomycetota bacterium]